MPVKKTKDNCYRWGNTGKEYCGKGAKAKAEKQGQAIQASRKKGE